MDVDVRQPVVSGMFYPARQEDLATTVAELLGDSGIPNDALLESPCGLIAPHAGYLYSGPTAAAGYGAIAQLGRPDTVVVLGANHTGQGAAVSLDDHATWRTPLGDVRVSRKLIRKLAERGLAVDRSAFAREHSVEVQLPFLQALWGNAFEIIPICVQPTAQDLLADVGQTIADALGETQAVLIVASSDFTHYEPDAVARQMDHRALEPILERNPARFLELCMANRLSICGTGAIAVLMYVAAELKLTEVALANYSTSGDTSGDRDAVVGYASVTFTRRSHG